jgi:hypothetical protein
MWLLPREGERVSDLGCGYELNHRTLLLSLEVAAEVVSGTYVQQHIVGKLVLLPHYYHDQIFLAWLRTTKATSTLMLS